jgi:hypothetical protein
MITVSPYLPNNSNGPVYDRNPTNQDKDWPLSYIWISRVGEASGSIRYMAWINVGQGQWLELRTGGFVVAGSGGEA